MMEKAKELAAVNNRDQISHLIGVLTRDFVNSRSPHAKKGGLIGLASVAIGLRDVRMPAHRDHHCYAEQMRRTAPKSRLTRLPKFYTLTDVPVLR